MTITATDLSPEACVNRGALLLDEQRPGWAKEIDQDRLAMGSCDDCILGQLYGNYIEGWRKLKTPHYCGTLKFGFDAFSDSDNRGRRNYRTLADLWRAEIAKRITLGEPKI